MTNFTVFIFNKTPFLTIMHYDSPSYSSRKRFFEQ
nr:MAG TPA: hypothetical protein [Caudoviricetes sp.]